MGLGLILGGLAVGCGDEATEGPTATRLAFRFSNVSAASALIDGAGGPVDITFAPGVWAIYEGESPVVEGEAASVAGLETLAEDGAPAAMKATLAGSPGVAQAGTFSTLEALTYDESPIGPGQSVTVAFEARPGARLFVATMFAESNDAFVGGFAVALFDADGAPLLGDREEALALWDAGTEVNEPPGAGAFQPATQPATNTGPDEVDGVVRRIDGEDGEGNLYPAVSAMAGFVVEAR